MKQPLPVDIIRGVFYGPNDLEKWALTNREAIAGQFCFVALIEGWYIMAEWNGNPETLPVPIARHTRGFWEYNGLESFQGLRQPRKSEV